MSAKIVLLIFFTSFLLVFLDFTKIQRNIKNYIFDLFCFVLILFAASKTADTCYDTKNYVTLYESVSTLDQFIPYISGYEPGWELLCIFFNMLGFDYHVYFFFLSAIVILIYRFVILRKCNNIFIALFTYVSCFYFLNEIIVLRHGLASSLIFLEIYFLSENKRKRAFLCVCFAFFFHSVGILGLILFLIKNKNISYKSFLLIPLALIFNDWIFVQFLKILNTILISNALSMVLIKIETYLQNESPAGSIKTIVIYSVPFVMTFLMLLNQKNKNPYLKECSLCMILSAFFMLAFSSAASFSRMHQLFLTGNIAMSSFYLDEYKKKKDEFLIIPIFMMINSYIFLRQNFMNSGGNIFY